MIEDYNRQITAGLPVEIRHNYTIITNINEALLEMIKNAPLPTLRARRLQLKITKLTCRTVHA